MFSIGQTLNLGQPINLACPLNRGLVSRWQVINQGPYSGGARLLDLNGKNHGGTLAATQTFGGALGRPGGWGRLESPKSVYSKTVTGSQAISVSYSCWARWTLVGATDYPANAFGTIESGTPTTTDRYFGFGATTIFFEIYDGAAKFATYTSGANDDIWWHLAGTADGTNIRIYVNGVLQGTTLAGNPFAGYSDPRIRFGTFEVSATTMIDDARVADRVWSDSEVAAIYQDSRQGSPLTLNWLRRVTVFDVGGGAAATAYESQITRSVAITRSNSY